MYVWLGRAWRAWHLRVVGALVLSGLPLSMVLFALGQSLPALLLFAALFGIANGLVTIVRGGLVPLYFGRSHVGRIGELMSGIGLLSRATAPLAASALLGLLPGYRELLLVLAGLGVAAVLAFWRASLDPPRSAFGVLAGRAGPQALPFGRHQRHAVCVRPQPPRGQRQRPGGAGSAASA